MKGKLIVILLVFVTAVLLNVIILSEGFVTAEGKDKICLRKDDDVCTKKIVNGTEGCYDSKYFACDPDCCDSSATIITTDGICYKTDKTKDAKCSIKPNNHGTYDCVDSDGSDCDLDCCNPSAKTVIIEPKDNKCVRRNGDICKKKTIDGKEGCFDLRNFPCDPDCCDSSAEIVINTPKDGTCFRRKGDKCTKKIRKGVEGCYDSSYILCDPDCCDSSSDVVTNLGGDDDSSSIKDIFNTFFSTYKPKDHHYTKNYSDTNTTDNSTSSSDTKTDYKINPNQDELDKAFNNLSDEAKTSNFNKIRSILRSDIQKAVKDELLASRATNPVDTSSSGTSSSSLQQGSCFRGDSTDSSACNTTNPYAIGQQGCNIDSVKPTPSVDMSQYIRKDSIPCYGCTLPQ